MSGHILLVDASGFAHRAYHAGGAQYRESDGLPTWAITGFLGLMWRLVGDSELDPPTHVAAVFDAPGKTFRHKMFPSYKNNRPARAAELAAQLPYMRHAAEAMGIAHIEHEGFEADDVIATLATQAVRAGIRTTVVSSDKDMCQLVRDGWVEIVDPVQNVRLRESDIRGKKFGVEPHQVPEYQALAGDAVDNIPGVDSIGPKTAAALIRIFKTVEAVMDGANGHHHAITPGQRVVLRGQLENLRLYRELARLRTDVPLKTDWATLERRPVMREHIETFLAKLEARERFAQIFGTETCLRPEVSRKDSPFSWWSAAVKRAPNNLPITPQCGFYKVRLHRGGVWVGARIWRELAKDPVTQKPNGKETLFCTAGMKEHDPVQWWPRLSLNPISEADYDYLTGVAQWARDHAPSHPEANPNKPVDWLTCPL